VRRRARACTRVRPRSTFPETQVDYSGKKEKTKKQREREREREREKGRKGRKKIAEEKRTRSVHVHGKI